MYIIPSIDILAGRCVRLYQGDYGKKTDYGGDPAAVAKAFGRAGAVRIHVVDLDAARAPSHETTRNSGAGRVENRETIAHIREAFDGILEVGGGIRRQEDVEELLAIGVDRLVIGTLLVIDPGRVEGWIETYGKRFLAGIDAREGEVKVSGWEEGTQLRDTTAAETARRIGMSGIIYTSIANDGTLSGPDIENTARMARESGLPVILSGGIGSTEDIRSVATGNHPGIVGIISGKAVFEGRLDLDAIFRTFPQPEKKTTW